MLSPENSTLLVRVLAVNTSLMGIAPVCMSPPSNLMLKFAGLGADIYQGS